MVSGTPAWKCGFLYFFRLSWQVSPWANPGIHLPKCDGLSRCLSTRSQIQRYLGKAAYSSPLQRLMVYNILVKPPRNSVVTKPHGCPLGLWSPFCTVHPLNTLRGMPSYSIVKPHAPDGLQEHISLSSYLPFSGLLLDWIRDLQLLLRFILFKETGSIPQRKKKPLFSPR